MSSIPSRRLHIRTSGDMLLHMRTSIDLSDALFRRAKRVANKRQTTLKNLVEDGLRKVLDEDKPERKFQLLDASFGDGGLVEGLSETNWEKIRGLSYEGRGG